MATPSIPGSVRFAVGAGLLTVGNDFVVFVSPAGPVADTWSDLAKARLNESAVRSALDAEIPLGHHVAVLHLVNGGIAMLAAPGADRIFGSLRPSSGDVIRFGMHPGPGSAHWIGAGAVGASGFEIDGFVFSAIDSEVDGIQDGPPPPSIRSAPVDGAASEPLPPRSEFFSAPAAAPPPPAAGGASANPQVNIPPPSPPAPDSPVPPSGALSIRFDDGQELVLDHPMAVGRAPEGSADAPEGAVVVVVSGDQVSRCHFVIRPTRTGAEVIDTNSLNGCFLDDANRAGSGPQIPVGVPVPIEPGQRFRFGDRSLTLIGRVGPT